MFICIIILLVLLPVTVMTYAIETTVSPDELAKMGVCLEH